MKKVIDKGKRSKTLSEVMCKTGHADSTDFMFFLPSNYVENNPPVQISKTFFL